jgi:hypothetical protein
MWIFADLAGSQWFGPVFSQQQQQQQQFSSLFS